jgi:DNA-binding Lrp family transcriptional regulator
MVQKRDLIILSNLRKNARMGLTQMSKQTRVPVSTIHDRLKAYLGSYVLRNTALLNFQQIGFHTRVTLMLRASPKDKEQLRDFLAKAISVNSLYRINNGFDFLADCVFRDMQELEDFLDKAEKQFDIKAKQLFFVIDDIKREAFLSDPQLVDLVCPP